MSGLIDSLIKMLKDSNAGFISTKVGEYTIIVTDDDDGAKALNEAWDKYAEVGENDDRRTDSILRREKQEHQAQSGATDFC